MIMERKIILIHTQLRESVRKAMADEQSTENGPLIDSLKSYSKLCSKPANRGTIIKDKTFIQTLTGLLSSNDPVVMTIIVKCMLYLTESKEHALALTLAPGVEEAIGLASERPFSPTILHNLIVVASRVRSAKTLKKENTGVASVSDPPLRQTKFVGKKSKQLVYEFDNILPEEKALIEQLVCKKKGVISIYFSNSNNRLVIRAIQTVTPEDLLNILFDCRFDMVTQIVVIDGKEERFCFYASERRNKEHVQLPDYLDDIEVADPNSCVVTYEHAKSSGWFSSITSFVSGSLW